MSQLEDLIAAQRASAIASQDAAVKDQNQALESGNANLDTENADVAPGYDKLINETNSAYQGNLEKARYSASDAGVYRSGIRYNQELKLGAQNAQQTSEYAAERTRKLADISRRRSLLAKQTQENIGSIRNKMGADLEATLAELRYKDYQAKEAERVAREQQERQIAAQRAAAASSDPYASLNIGKSLLEDINAAKASGINREQAFNQLIGLYEKYGYDGNKLMGTVNSIYGDKAPATITGSGSGVFSNPKVKNNAFVQNFGETLIPFMGKNPFK